MEFDEEENTSGETGPQTNFDHGDQSEEENGSVKAPSEEEDNQEQEEDAQQQETGQEGMDSGPQERELDIPDLPADRSGAEVVLVRSQILRFEPSPYDPNTLSVSEQDEKKKLEFARARIRHRFTHEHGSLKHESNAHLVQWSDGSWHMFVGKNAFTMPKSDMSSQKSLLCARLSADMLVCHGKFMNRIDVNPCDRSQVMGSNASAAAAAGGKRVKKQTKLTAQIIGETDEKQLKQIEAQKRLMARRQQRQMGSMGGVSTDDLEEGSGDVSAIKGSFGKRKGATQAELEEEARSRRLQESKRTSGAGPSVVPRGGRASGGRAITSDFLEANESPESEEEESSEESEESESESSEEEEAEEVTRPSRPAPNPLIGTKAPILPNKGTKVPAKRKLPNPSSDEEEEEEEEIEKPVMRIGTKMPRKLPKKTPASSGYSDDE